MFRTVKYGNLPTYLGAIHDALQFDLKLTPRADFIVYRPSRLTTKQAIAGPAFTCQGTSVSSPKQIKDNIRIDMLDAMYDGCIQVIGGCWAVGVAHYGDISAALARSSGAIGCFMDGYTRDADIIEQMDFPVWGKGTRPEDAYGQWQISSYQCPVDLHLPNRFGTISPGDWVFADGDGVIVVPADALEETIKYALARAANEDQIREALKTNTPPRS